MAFGMTFIDYFHQIHGHNLLVEKSECHGIYSSIYGFETFDNYHTISYDTLTIQYETTETNGICYNEHKEPTSKQVNLMDEISRKLIKFDTPFMYGIKDKKFTIGFKDKNKAMLFRFLV